MRCKALFPYMPAGFNIVTLVTKGETNKKKWDPHEKDRKARDRVCLKLPEGSAMCIVSHSIRKHLLTLGRKFSDQERLLCDPSEFSLLGRLLIIQRWIFHLASGNQQINLSFKIHLLVYPTYSLINIQELLLWSLVEKTWNGLFFCAVVWTGHAWWFVHSHGHARGPIQRFSEGAVWWNWWNTWPRRTV